MKPAEQIAAAIAEAAAHVNECGSSVLYHDLHVADGNLQKLVTQLDEARSERDGYRHERDHIRGQRDDWAAQCQQLQGRLDEAYMTIGLIVSGDPDTIRKVLDVLPVPFPGPAPDDH